MTLGRHFAITQDDERKLLSLAGQEAIVELIQEDIEARYEAPWFCDTDKAWDAIHRAFSGGSLNNDYATPRHGIILGGRSLYQGEDYIIVYKSPSQVGEIAASLAAVTKGEFERLYLAFPADDYRYFKSAEDYAYSWEWLSMLEPFYRHAAANGRAVCFTADQ